MRHAHLWCRAATRLAASLTVVALSSGCSSQDGDLAVGDPLPPLHWQGYVNEQGDTLSTLKPVGPYSTTALGQSKRRFALLHLSESF